MFQIAFLTLGLVVLTLVIAFIFKKQQRVILWAAALILFIGTCLMIGLGVVNIYENGVVNQNTLFSVILAFFCSAKFACDAEKTHRALQKKAATLVEQSSNPPNDDKDKAADEVFNASHPFLKADESELYGSGHEGRTPAKPKSGIPYINSAQIRVASVQDRRLPINTRDIYRRFFSALPAPVPLYFERVVLNV